MRPHLSVLVPAYNEETLIGRSIERICHEICQLGVAWELLVVDDGSSDRTREIVRTAAQSDRRIRLVAGDHKGKGAAVRQGLLAASGEWVFVADADLSMAPAELRRLLAETGTDARPQVVIASREAPGARRVGEPWMRHLVGRAFNLLAQTLAVPGINDTQCGYKLLSARAAATLAPYLTIAGWAFDVELLYLARRAGFDVREVGITWQYRRDTRVRLYRGAAAFADLIRLRLRAIQGRYDGLPRHGRPGPAPAALS